MQALLNKSEGYPQMIESQGDQQEFRSLTTDMMAIFELTHTSHASHACCMQDLSYVWNMSRCLLEQSRGFTASIEHCKLRGIQIVFDFDYISRISI